MSDDWFTSRSQGDTELRTWLREVAAHAKALESALGEITEWAENIEDAYGRLEDIAAEYRYYRALADENRFKSLIQPLWEWWHELSASDKAVIRTLSVAEDWDALIAQLDATDWLNVPEHPRLT